MSYTHKTLGSGESVHLYASTTWLRCVPALFYSLLAVGLTAPFIGPLSLLGFYWLATALLDRWTSEYAITNRRVISKTGFIRRTVQEINWNRVEGSDFEQSIWGRLFNYGHIRVRGQGNQTADFLWIHDPLQVKRTVQEYVDSRSA